MWRKRKITTFLLVVAALALLLWVVMFTVQRQTQPKYKDCPWCKVTIRYRASICPNCAKFVPVEE